MAFHGLLFCEHIIVKLRAFPVIKQVCLNNLDRTCMKSGMLALIQRIASTEGCKLTGVPSKTPLLHHKFYWKYSSGVPLSYCFNN